MRLPSWADEWAPGVTCCGCPAVRCGAMGKSFVVCSVSGWGIEKCQADKASAPNASLYRPPPPPDPDYLHPNDPARN